LGTCEPRDLLIQCAGCSIENLFTAYTPDRVTVCNQCRERLLWPNFNETHREYRCRDCGFAIALLKTTAFEEGNTPCRCESLNVARVQPSRLAEEAEAAGAFHLDADPASDHGGFDWCRPESTPGSEDYNELFDQDPGHN